MNPGEALTWIIVALNIAAGVAYLVQGDLRTAVYYAAGATLVFAAVLWPGAS